MGRKYPCGICNKSVKCNQKGLKCTTCLKWIHLSCSDVSLELYNDCSEKFTGWECTNCWMKQIPFFNTSLNSSITENVHVHEDCKTDSKTSQELRYSVLSNTKGIKFMQLNVVSLLKHLDEIKLILYSNDIHICTLNETRLDASIDNHEIDIPHYSLVRKDRNRNGGGVAIYVHESINYERVEHSSLNDLEAILISIKLKNAKPLLLINWYRPPNSKSSIFDSYEDVLSFMETFHCYMILMGDINIDISKDMSCDKKKYCQINVIHEYASG